MALRTIGHLLGVLLLVGSAACSHCEPRGHEIERQARQPSPSAQDERPPAAPQSSAASSGIEALPATAQRAPAALPPDAGAASDAASTGAARARRSSCQAPSLELHDPIDARDAAAISSCVDLRVAMRFRKGECKPAGSAAPLDLPRLEASVLTLDDATAEHVRTIAALGAKLGRNRRAFGLVGDSITVSHAFLRPFSADRPGRFTLEDELRRALVTAVSGAEDATIIDYYRGVPAQRVGSTTLDSFAATRAAKVGARSSWAIQGDREDRSPVALMVQELSPAVAVVVYGANDAAFRVAPPEQVAQEFTHEFGLVLDALERRGVVPILSTIMRHGPQPGREDCGAGGSEPSDWRLAVQTNAVSAAIATIACERHLPLMDLRFALDSLPNRGLGPDGVHLSASPDGGGLLTRQGLGCGYNVRNYLTLRMLKEVKEAIGPGGLPSGLPPREQER